MRLNSSHGLFVLMCVIWGATWLATKLGLATVPPILFAGTRFIVAGLLLLAVLAARGAGLRIARADWPRLALVTLLIVVGCYSLLFWGVLFVPSGLAAILNMAFMPMALLTLGVLAREEAASAGQVAGIAVGVAGLLLLFGPKALAGGGGDGMELVGGAAIVLSALVYAWGSVLARPLLRQYSSGLVAGATMLGGGVVLLLGAVLGEAGAVTALGGAWGVQAWAGWWFLVLFGSLAAYTIYLHLVRIWGASRAGIYAFISPAVAVLLGVAWLGETVTLMDAAGMATMLAGAWLTLRGGARSAN